MPTCGAVLGTLMVNLDPVQGTVSAPAAQVSSAADGAMGLLWGTGLLLPGCTPGCPGGISPDGDVVPASPDAVVPALSLGLMGLHTRAMAHRSPTQAVAPLDFVGDNPDLIQRPHGHSAHIVGHVLPAGALWVAGRDPLAIPQVPIFVQGVH